MANLAKQIFREDALNEMAKITATDFFGKEMVEMMINTHMRNIEEHKSQLINAITKDDRVDEETKKVLISTIKNWTDADKRKYIRSLIDKGWKNITS